MKKGFIAEMRGNFDEAVKCYSGVSSSKTVQDREYKCRETIKRNTEKTDKIKCLLKRIDNGDVDALWQMTLLFKKENDTQESVKWFNLALENGQTDALLCAAKACLDKNSSIYNKKKAVKYLEQAANNGSGLAMRVLGDIEAEKCGISFFEYAAKINNINNLNEKTDKRNLKCHKKQMNCYISAAQSGDTDSMNALSMAYHLGYPTARDDVLAFLYASRAADLSDPTGLYQTAYFYENGFGNERDFDTAVLLYTQSAEYGVKAASVRLYEIYTDVCPDKEKADYYLSQIQDNDT